MNIQTWDLQTWKKEHIFYKDISDTLFILIILINSIAIISILKHFL